MNNLDCGIIKLMNNLGCGIMKLSTFLFYALIKISYDNKHVIYSTIKKAHMLVAILKHKNESHHIVEQHKSTLPPSYSVLLNALP